MKDTIVKQFMKTVLLIFIMQIMMLAYIFTTFYKDSAGNIKEMGISNMKSQATMVEDYLGHGRDVLWLAAETVDFMVGQRMDQEDILDYLKGATVKMQERFDVNFTGIYGLIDGHYIDGSGWIPPEDYEPAAREWYIEAMKKRGSMVISPPYVDAQTGEIIISISCQLSDGESVISLDIVLNEVQNTVENMTMGGMGYGFIVNRDGLVISHCDRSEVGKNYYQEVGHADLIREIMNGDGDEFEMNVDGEASTIFSHQIVEDWYVVIVCRDELLFEDLRKQIFVGCALSVMVFLVIVAFCVFSVRRIKKAQNSETESLEKLDHMNSNIIRALATTIDAKDRYTSGHSQRVAEYALAIAQRMGKSEEEQKVILYAALLHDVGKIRVPNEVINKPGRLTDEEFDQIKLHPVSGYHILRDIHEDERIGEGAKYHHERYDGHGYPNGLKGEDIPEVARIIGVADAYDAMASNRSYRNALPQNVIREEFVKGRGKQFDPKIADIMIEMIDEDKEYRMCQKEKAAVEILILDEDSINTNMLDYIFSELPNVMVLSVRTIEEADAVLGNGNVSLVLLNLDMKGQDGFVLYQEICSRYGVPVVVITEEKSKDTLKKMKKLRINDYITKPFSPVVVREMAHGIINHTKTGTLWGKRTSGE